MADTLTGKAVKFIADNKAKPFFLYFATHDIHVPRVPHPRFRTSPHGLRGAAIQEFDWSVGEVLKTLDDLKLADNTLVIVTSDNGGVMDDGYIDGTQNDASGHKCNGVLRGYKGGLYEGGHRLPFIARWPGKVPAGKTSNELICHVDLMATMADLLGKELPATAGPDSFDILPALLAEKPAKPCRTTLVNQAGGVNPLAFRQGPWKLIPAGNAKANPNARNPVPAMPQLFDLSADLSETKNLAAEHPEKVKELTESLQTAREAERTRP
jgi:arylsulfatase A-like enzyme